MKPLKMLTLALALLAPAAAGHAADTAMVTDPCAAAPALSDADKAFRDALLVPGTPFSLPKATPEDAAKARAQMDKDWPNLCRYHAANAALQAPVNVVFMGDSISELWGLADPAFFSQGVVDRGISGQTSTQMLTRFYADVIALHPKVVHLLAGGNDIAGNTGPTTVESYENNIRAMTELARAHHIRVILGSLTPADRLWWAPDLRPADQVEALNRWLRAYAKAQGFTFVNYHAALTSPGGGMADGLTNDGVHPNRKGFEIMTRLAQRALATVR